MTIGRRLSRFAAITALFATLFCGVSCMVGPDYKHPDVRVGDGYKSPATQPLTAQEIAPDWWKLFGDPVLDDLEDQAAKASPTLQAALARLDQARAVARATYADLFPTIDFDPSIERARTPPGSANSGGSTGSGFANNSNTGRTRTTTRIPFDLNYELDVWGKYRRGLEAERAQVRASAADYEVVMQTLRADVATNYFSLRSLDQQEKIFEKNVASYERQVSLTQGQLKAGIVSRLDVAQATAQLRTTLAQRTDIRRQRIDVEHALATLLGRTPSKLSLDARPLDLTPPVVPAGMPGDLIRRRPDVYQAEQNLVSANAQVGVAIAAFYPQVQLTGSAGFESFDVRHSLDWEQRVWSLGAGLTMPVFDAGRIKANVDQAKARYAELLADYQNAVLTAVRDVEDSLTDLRLRAEQADDQQEAVKASQEYLELSQKQYEQGLVAYFTVIDADRTLLSNELSAAQTLNQRMASTVLLIKSLGGGWHPDDGASSQPASPGH